VLEWPHLHADDDALLTVPRRPPPCSYGAILGGLCTIIGTSTNLIVRGLATNDYKDLRFGFFEIGIAGGPVVALALLYILFVAPHLLANRKGITELAVETRRQYTFSAVVNKLFPGMGK
jgi:di/tricarboxylate transporter